MKIKIGNADADYRVSGGVSMRYRAKQTYSNVPSKIGEWLIAQGKAEEVAVKSKTPTPPEGE